MDSSPQTHKLELLFLFLQKRAEVEQSYIICPGPVPEPSSVMASALWLVRAKEARSIKFMGQALGCSSMTQYMVTVVSKVLPQKYFDTIYGQRQPALDPIPAPGPTSPP